MMSTLARALRNCLMRMKVRPEVGERPMRESYEDAARERLTCSRCEERYLSSRFSASSNFFRDETKCYALREVFF